MPYDTKAVANYFIELANIDNEPITPMKLLKLMYYAHGWHLAIVGQPLLDERIEAWQHGPVIPSIYKEFKKYGNEPIDDFATEYDAYDYRWETPTLPPGDDYEYVRQILQKIWSVYKPYDALQLSSMTHADGSPWAQTVKACGGRATRNVVIDDNLMREFFRAKNDTAAV